ncbi:hypothetical protein ACFQU2_15630 [Siccirubricoccus deserti]
MVFVSDNPHALRGQQESLAAHLGSSEAANRLLTGGAQVHAGHGHPPDRPGYYTEAYVPTWRGGEQIGVAEVYLDQSAKHELYHRAFLFIEFGIAGLMLLAGLLPVFVAWRRTCQRRVAECRAESSPPMMRSPGCPTVVECWRWSRGDAPPRPRRHGGTAAGQSRSLRDSE